MCVHLPKRPKLPQFPHKNVSKTGYKGKTHFFNDFELSLQISISSLYKKRGKLKYVYKQKLRSEIMSEASRDMEEIKLYYRKYKLVQLFGKQSGNIF